MNHHLNLICRYPHAEYQTPKGVGTIEQILVTDNAIVVELATEIEVFDSTEIKPILKPLSSLTEEQEEQLCRLVTQNSDLAATFIEGNFVIYEISTGDYYFDYEPSKYPTCVTRQLEAWGICYEPELVKQGYALLEA